MTGGILERLRFTAEHGLFASVQEGKHASSKEAADTVAELLEALNHYADQLCEGWCERSPDCAHFDDCAGCLARRTAYKATGAA